MNALHTPALGNSAEGVFQDPRTLRQTWSNDPALDSSSSVPYIVGAMPTVPQTQPRPPNKIRQCRQAPSAATYARFENARCVPSSNAVSKHDIKSEYGISSQPNSRIPNFPSQMHCSHESSDTYVDNVSNALRLYSAQSSQLSPLNHMPLSQTPRLPSLPTSRTPHSQPPIIEGTSGHTGESPTYVNVKQFHRILKRRIVRQRLEEKLPQTRKSYQHESRHQHATRRPRGAGGRFLTQKELERRKKELRSGQRHERQIPKTRIGPSADHAKEESADWTSGMPIKDEGGERREEVRNGSRDKETNRPVVMHPSKARSEHQIKAKGSFEISKAMTTSFYGAAELEELGKRFPSY